MTSSLSLATPSICNLMDSSQPTGPGFGNSVQRPTEKPQNLTPLQLRSFDPSEILKGIQLREHPAFVHTSDGTIPKEKLNVAFLKLLDLMTGSIGRKAELEKDGEITLSSPLEDGSQVILKYEATIERGLIAGQNGRPLKVLNLKKVTLRTRGGKEYLITQSPLNDEGNQFSDPTYAWATKMTTNPDGGLSPQATRLLDRPAIQKIAADHSLNVDQTKPMVDLIKDLAGRVDSGDQQLLNQLLGGLAQVDIPKRIADPALFDFLETWNKRFAKLKISDWRPMSRDRDRYLLYTKFLLRSSQELIGKVVAKTPVKILLLGTLAFTVPGFLKFYGGGSLSMAKQLSGQGGGAASTGSVVIPIVIISPALASILSQINPDWRILDSTKPADALQSIQTTPGEFFGHIAQLSGDPATFQKSPITLYAGTTNIRDLFATTYLGSGAAQIVKADSEKPDEGTLILHLKQSKIAVVSHWREVSDLTKTQIQYVVVSEKTHPKLYSQISQGLAHGYSSLGGPAKLWPDPK